MGNILKAAGVGLAALLIVLAALFGAAAFARLVVQKQHEAAAEIGGPHGVREAGYVKIGGIEQWVEIRGRDRRNPALLFLHGGPGVPLGPVAYSLLADLEKDFVVVQWDQPGAGRTYGRSGPPPPEHMSLQQFERDTIELSQHLTQRLGKDRIGLVGASAGSAFGLMAAHDRPDLYYAYVGTGQVISMNAAEALAYEHVRRAAIEAGDGKALADLDRIGSAPYADFEDSLVLRRWMTAYGSPSERRFNDQWRLLATMLTAPGYRLMDFRDMLAGSEHTAKVMIPKYAGFDARRLGPEFQTPLVFMQGSEDLITPTALVREFLAKVEAPTEMLIVFPGGGHTAILEAPAEFRRQLVQHVKPLAAHRPTEDRSQVDGGKPTS